MLAKVRLRARAKRDYWIFLARHELPIVLGVFGLVLGVATILPNAAAIALSVIALLLGLITFVNDYRNAKARWSAYEFRPAGAMSDSAQPLPEPIDYRQAHYEAFPGRGTAIVDSGVDRYLQTHIVGLRVAEQPYRLPDFLADTAPQILRTTVQGSVVFNGPVLGLSDDPLPMVTGDPIPVGVHRARFFDGQCSNELCALEIRHRDTGEVYDLRQRVLVDSAGRLASLAETDLANIVGISTIAVTTDDLVVIIVQTSNNSASRSLLAPSGSGSLEPKDLAPGASLQQLVIVGMERELSEECGIEPDEIAGTRVVGYARWLERGAKPEFFGVTRLRCSS
ncbi:MAG: hypothetical protein ACRDPW_00610, partial [Mycobacteriales bacterium]